MNNLDFQNHLSSATDLVTSHEQTRAGFIAMALEKNKAGNPIVREATVLKTLASRLTHPIDLLTTVDIRRSLLLTASGMSDKAIKYLTDEDERTAILNFVRDYLEPAGDKFVDELVFRFLLTRGETLGGKMKNLAGTLAELKLVRTLVATMSVRGIPFHYLAKDSKPWRVGSPNDAALDFGIKGLSWQNSKGNRTLIFNIKVPIVDKNVDLCLFASSQIEYSRSRPDSVHIDPTRYLSLGELKGGIDPAGADERWKTARSAIRRITEAFEAVSLSPKIFFIAAAIQPAMAKEIFAALNNGSLTNAANLSVDDQTVSVCNWLISV